MLGRGDDLARARTALERGNPKRAVRHAWRAAFSARREGDEVGLQAVVALAADIRDKTSGSVEQEAESVRIYGERCLADEREGVRPAGALAGLLGRGSRQRVKTCPDCAETVKAEARVCRFCGYRFTDPP